VRDPIDAFEIAQRFVGVKETPGAMATPIILAMLRLDGDWPPDDGVAWCSAFVNWVCWLLRLPRSKSLAARSWLTIGRGVTLDQAQIGNDIVVLERDGGGGHVGFYAGIDAPTTNVLILGGNQHDGVNVSAFPMHRVLGVRRLV
jgi:uncharacterized protein (TIGR02594 family)